jgi:2',3'-cyclic-nucleotide 2'-phosphodiesterase (5'-nucleotidase family)
MKKIFLFLFLLIGYFSYAEKIISMDNRLVKLGQTTVNSKEAKKMEQLIAPYKTQLDSTMNIVIGYAPERLTDDDPQGGVCAYFSNALLNYTRQTEQMNVDAAILNIGGFRKSINAGNITIRDIYELMPFENMAVTADIKGEDLHELINAFALKGGEATAGISFDIKDGKAINISISNQIFDPQKTYHIVTSDYLLGGNDGMKPLTNSSNQQFLNKPLRDIFIEYIKQETAQGKLILNNLQ